MDLLKEFYDSMSIFTMVYSIFYNIFTIFTMIFTSYNAAVSMSFSKALAHPYKIPFKCQNKKKIIDWAVFLGVNV